MFEGFKKVKTLRVLKFSYFYNKKPYGGVENCHLLFSFITLSN